MALLRYLPLCDAIVLLMQPLVEVVIHDLVTKKICYIKGGLSKRVVGDPSLLEDDLLEEEVAKIIYPKINFDGRLIKSISVLLEKKWFLCINMDISLFNQMKELGDIFLKLVDKEQPKSLFKNDWQEKVHIAISGYLQHKHLKFEAMNGLDKKNLVKHLFDIDAFSEKNAADYIARVLNLGRATVFKYLKEWRK